MSDEEVFKVTTLLIHIRKQNIDVKSIYSFENRIIFLCITYKDIGLDMFIYVPTKYNIQVEKSIGLPLYELSVDDVDSVK